MAITVKANGKTFTFPDGTTNDQIGEAIDDHFSVAAQSVNQNADLSGNFEDKEARLAADIEAAQNSNNVSSPQAMLIGAGKGMVDVGRTIGGLVGLGANDEQASRENEQFSELKNDHPITSRVGEFIGETVATAPLGGIAGAAGRGVSTGIATRLGAQAGSKAANIAGLAGMGAAEGAAVSAQLGEDVGVGAGVGAGVGVLAPTVIRAGQAAFTRLTGKAPVDEVLNKTTGELTESAAKELSDSGITIEQLSKEIQDTIKTDFNPGMDIAPQVRQAQLNEFVPGVEARTSRLSRDISAQNAEEGLVALGTPEGRNIVSTENSIKEGLDSAAQTKLLGDIDTNLIANFNTVSDDANKGILGVSAKDAISEIKKAEEAVVNDLYSLARSMAGDGYAVNSDNILSVFKNGANDLAPSDGLMGAVGRALKEYDVIPQSGDLGDSFTFKAPKEVKPLTLDNAESLRQRLNKIDPVDGSQDSLFVGSIRHQLDNDIDTLIDQFPEQSAIASAFRDARRASAAFRRLFNNKKLVSKLIDVKKGSDVDSLASEDVLDVILRSDLDGVKHMKSLMLENPTANSKKAWNQIRFTTIDEVLRGAVDRSTGSLSGGRLNTSLAKIGDERLKLILGADKFKQIKRFQGVLNDQTIPLKRLENPSGSAGPIMSMVSALGDVMKGSANASSGGLVNAASKSAAQRKAIEQSISDIRTSTGQTGRVKRLKAQQQIGRFLSELSTIGAVSGAGDNE